MTYYAAPDNLKVPLDHKLDKLFNKKTCGFYIELGANDGLNSSNTAFFAFTRNWKGCLIEPSPSSYASLLKNRPESYKFNYACVSSDCTDEFIYGDFNGNMMASVNGKRLHSPPSALIPVKTSTLTKILDSIEPRIQSIDLLSLDTEGYETNILNGLDFEKYRPKYILIEIYTEQYQGIVELLQSKNYRLHSNFTNYNHLTNPGWDGTHNDYLFIDNTALDVLG